jgi:xanthine/CO dehydrogenase XdhC/CoxF family maturation factor
MSDLESILSLWRELEAAGADYVLATLVAVEGSSYRKPGAHMLLAPDGRRAGTVSGGCLEAEVTKRAWWLTGAGPVVERYSTADDDGERPYGSGCGGVVYILLERRATAAPLLAALGMAFEQRIALGVATVVEGPGIGGRAFAGLPDSSQAAGSNGRRQKTYADRFTPVLRGLSERSLAQRAALEEKVPMDGGLTRTWASFLPARSALWIFGAGDDAIPLHRMAREMGWYVSVADGRSHLATRQRFPAADEVHVLPMAERAGIAAGMAAMGSIRAWDAAAVMAHSFEQDSRVLAALMALDEPPAYIGVLGPQRRTRELLNEAARLLGVPESNACEWMPRLHAPMGLDLGGEAPAAVALSVLAEIQRTLAAATGLPLRQVRADGLTPSNVLPAPQETLPATLGGPSTPDR